VTQIVHPGTTSIAHFLQARRMTDLAEALMETADWSTTLADKKRRRLDFFEKRIPTGLIRGQGFYRRGMNPTLVKLEVTKR
jgi:hypothetical protein